MNKKREYPKGYSLFVGEEDEDAGKEADKEEGGYRGKYVIKHISECCVFLINAVTLQSL